MRVAIAALLVLGLAIPVRSHAEANVTVTGPALPLTGLSATPPGNLPIPCQDPKGCGIVATGGTGLAIYAQGPSFFESNTDSLSVQSSEATAVVASGHSGINATGYLYGAQLSGGNAPLRLVPDGAPGPHAACNGAGEINLDSNMILWLCTAPGMPGTWVALNRQGPPSGSVSAFAGQSAPSGYLLCNGQAVSRTAYAALFAAIGTTYGAGDGTTTFNVPDLRGEFVRGLDAGRGVDAGRVLGAAQLDAIQQMTKSALAPVTGGWAAANGAFARDGQAVAHICASTCGIESTVTFDMGRVARTASETRPRNVAMNYIIKT